MSPPPSWMCAYRWRPLDNATSGNLGVRMRQALLVVNLLVWFPILYYNIHHRGFAVLLLWLFVAPVASNLINRPGANPLFQSAEEVEGREAREHRMGGYFTD